MDPHDITAPSGREGPLAPHVFIRNGAIFANSRDVAVFFEKEHRNVLQAIDSLIEQEPSLSDERLLKFQQSFAEVETGNGTFRQFRTFDMTRDGFSLLAMGFTGPRALKWKLRYIEAFNLMEARLAAPVVAQAGPSLSEQRAALDIVREARINFGPAAARDLWGRLGLPEIVQPEIAAPADLDWRGALRHLCLAASADGGVRVWAKVRQALGSDDGPGSEAAHIWLAHRGMLAEQRDEGWLFVSNAASWLQRHFAGTPWATRWRTALRAAPGAQGRRLYLGRRQQRGWRIPLKLITALAEGGGEA